MPCEYNIRVGVNAFGDAATCGELFKITDDPIGGQPALTFLEVPINTGNAFE